MALDVQKYLKSELGMADADIAIVLEKLTPFSDKLEKSVLMQADYSREMDKIKKTKDELAEANERLNADLAEFATLTADEQGNATKLKERIEAEESRSFRLTQKLTRLAEEHGVDPKTVLGDVEPAPEPKKVAAVAFDDKTLRKDLNLMVGGVASYMLDLNASIDDIAEEHQRLTGEKFNRRAFIDGIKKDIAANKTENLDPVKRWESQFGIPEKRIAASTLERETAIKNAREEGRVAGLSEAALPGGHQSQQGHESPVFKTSNVVKGSVMQRPQPSQRLSGAVSALTTGKYRKPAA
jgi:hypothetical protein